MHLSYCSRTSLSIRPYAAICDINKPRGRFGWWQKGPMCKLHIFTPNLGFELWVAEASRIWMHHNDIQMSSLKSLQPRERAKQAKLVSISLQQTVLEMALSGLLWWGSCHILEVNGEQQHRAGGKCKAGSLGRQSYFVFRPGFCQMCRLIGPVRFLLPSRKE